MDGITLTERAARRINEIMAAEPVGSMLRISVNGGGCSGFQYAFDVDLARQDDDTLVERDGAAVLVDQVSLQYMDGRGRSTSWTTSSGSPSRSRTRRRHLAAGAGPRSRSRAPPSFRGAQKPLARNSQPPKRSRLLSGTRCAAPR